VANTPHSLDCAFSVFREVSSEPKTDLIPTRHSTGIKLSLCVANTGDLHRRIASCLKDSELALLALKRKN
jgi:hypothetical protein